MKRIISFLLLLSAFAAAASGQTRYLVNVAKPVESVGYKPYRYNGPSSEKLAMQGGQSWYGGFLLNTLHLPTTPGRATFRLGGQYETIMFAVGMHPETFGEESCAVTVTADGRKIFDEVVRHYDVPRRFTLDISGVDELKFAIAAGDGNISFGEVTLWKSGEKPVYTGNLPSAPKVSALVSDIKPYAQYRHSNVSPEDKIKSVKVNGKSYDYGIVCNMEMALIGENPGASFFDLGGQYETLDLLVGPVNGGDNGASGWVTINADGKPIYEYEISSTDIAKRLTLDVTGCRQLAIRSEQTAQNMYAAVVDAKVYPKGTYRKDVSSEAEVSEDINPRLKSLPDVCKLISNIPPYSVAGKAEHQVYDGSSDHLTFSMGGTRFSEGVILYEKASFWNDNTVSYAVFDVGREFDYVSFTAGYVGKSWNMNNDYIRVLADDEVVFETPILSTGPNMHFTVPIKKCRKLRFENGGSGRLEVAAYGIADIVLYRGEPVENNLFVHPVPVCPDEIDLIDLGKPYIHYVSKMEDNKEDMLQDGSTKRHYFTMPDGSRIYKGFLLQTSTHFSLDYNLLGDDGFDAKGETNNTAGAMVGAAAVGAAFVPIGAVGSAVVGSTLMGAAAFLILAAGGTALDNSCAAFNTYGQYNSVTFTVACQQPSSVSSDYKETLLIGADHVVMAELTVYETMEPQTVTVPIDGCEQLMFWLANTGGSSARYVFYDITVSKEKKELYIPKGARLSKTVVTEPAWTGKPLETQWERPSSTKSSTINQFFVDCSNMYSTLRKLMENTPPAYTIHTTYLETPAGGVCKAVSLKDRNDNYTDIHRKYEYCIDDIKSLRKLKADLVNLGIAGVGANIALPEVGLSAVSCAKIIKRGMNLTSEAKGVVDTMLADKMAELSFLEFLVGSTGQPFGAASTRYTSICPLEEGDVIPDEQQLQLLANFDIR